MATHMVKAGIDLRGFDLNQAAMQSLADAGGVAALSCKDAARGQSLLHVVVAKAEQAEMVLFGDDGAVAELADGATVVLHSTVPPAFARRLGARLAETGHPFLDAPISGGRVGADAGTLTIMASGPEEAFAASERTIAAISRKVYRLGTEPGIGSTVKMINQHLAGVHIVSAAEAMALGARAGADPAILFDVISSSAGNSWMFGDRVPHMLERNFSPKSAVEIFIKDLGIVLETGAELQFPLPLAACAHQQYLAAAAAGHAKEDDAAVVKVYEQIAGIEVKG